MAMTAPRDASSLQKAMVANVVGLAVGQEAAQQVQAVEILKDPMTFNVVILVKRKSDGGVMRIEIGDKSLVTWNPNPLPMDETTKAKLVLFLA